VVLLLVVPSVTAVVAALLGQARAELVRRLCLAATLLNLALSLVVAVGFLNVRAEFPVPEQAKTLATFRPELVPGAAADDPHRTTWNLVELGPTAVIQLYLGVDGISVWLIVLTNLLLFASVLVSWTAITDRVHEYYAWLMALGTAMLGVFLSFDVVLFYVFFELTLVPLFFLIGIWGGPERRHAARKFFVYTLAGSLITFLGILAVVIVCWSPPFGTLPPAGRTLTFSIPELLTRFHALLAAAGPDQQAWWLRFQTWVFLAMFIGFAIKVPLFPVHTWLPLAHVEAPTAGSVLLAGVLLKLGTYGFLRLTLPFAPDACINLGVPLVGTLSVIGILYGAFCARAQDDIKKLVAYSSVSHLGFCTLGLFALNAAGLTGGLMQMINHGLSTGALFLIVGMLYERYHTRMMSDYGGIGARLGWLSACMVFVCLSSVGLPGLNGFIGEALVFFGMFDEQPVYAVIGTGGIILGAWYLMTMLRLVFFGPVREPHLEGEHHHVGDLNGREIATLAPILAACLLVGVYPQPILDSVRPDVGVVANILEHRQQELARRGGPVPAPLARADAGEE
jgi:NADH-quinone oxidoreductase subunit M